jgi:hypothetical protein
MPTVKRAKRSARAGVTLGLTLALGCAKASPPAVAPPPVPAAVAPAPASTPSPDAERRASAERTERERRTAAAMRRLEERVTLLTRELEVADAEIMRSRAKGVDTKAEASSAIAEAQILMQRAEAEKASLPITRRCHELLGEAEGHLSGERFGAARWLALKCQGLLEGFRRSPAAPAPPSDHPPR